MIAIIVIVLLCLWLGIRALDIVEILLGALTLLGVVIVGLSILFAITH